MCTKLKGQTKTFNIQKQYIFSNAKLSGAVFESAGVTGYLLFLLSLSCLPSFDDKEAERMGSMNCKSGMSWNKFVSARAVPVR
jgi:hypothetical protein